MDLGNIHMAFMLCNNLLRLEHEHGKERYFIGNETIANNCKNEPSKSLIIYMSGGELPQEAENTKVNINPGVAIQDMDKPSVTAKVKLSVQYLN